MHTMNREDFIAHLVATDPQVAEMEERYAAFKVEIERIRHRLDVLSERIQNLDETPKRRWGFSNHTL